ncbi:hypothetical protein EC14040_01525 [Escherichia coli O145:H28]|nr:hypothetical protein EC14040_01525 [Escherichia coli O145:H28]
MDVVGIVFAYGFLRHGFFRQLRAPGINAVNLIREIFNLS